jgi:Fe-S-cluster containining protein
MGQPCTEEEAAFMREHFYLIPQNGVGDGDFVETIGTFSDTQLPAYELWLACRAFDKAEKRCTKYGQRPRLCQKYLCPEADKGFTPLERRASRARYPGLLPFKTGDISRVRGVGFSDVVRNIHASHEKWRVAYDQMVANIPLLPEEEPNASSVSLRPIEGLPRAAPALPDNV